MPIPSQPTGSPTVNQYGQDNANNEGMKPTYRATLTAFGPYATPSDIVQLFNPAASTRTVRVSRVNVSGASTAASTNRILLIKRSATDTGGTSASVTMTPMDSVDPAPQATTLSWSAVPTGLGTAQGTIGSYVMNSPTLTAGGSAWIAEELFGAARGVKSCVLHAGEALCLNMNGAAVPSGLVLDIEIEWTEEIPPTGVAV